MQVIRQEYLNRLIDWKDRQVIKVVTGVRRCGKSTLLGLYRNYLLSEQVSENQIIFINFEDLQFSELADYKKVYEYITPLLQKDKMNYIFLDEIQHVEQFEKIADHLFIQENVDLYITGSNAFFMSGELTTLLTGRYIEIKMLPLSFKEYNKGIHEMYPDRAQQPLMELYQTYVQESSFPYTLQIAGQKEAIQDYLGGLYSSILLKDIVARLKIADVMMLESVIRFIFENIGNILSTRKIAGTMTSSGRKVDVKTIEKYIQGLKDGLLIYQVKRYNIKGKQHLVTNEKYYLTDMGLRYYLLGNKNIDQGRILENIVYLELFRRGYRVYVGSMRDGEVDFVAMVNENEIEYYQVAATVMDENTLKRELSSLQKIKDQYPKYLLTFDTLGAGSNYDGIRQLNVLDWLMGR